MISVVVVSYDTRELLRTTLSELGAVREEWDEVVIVDCASTDGTPEMVRTEFPSHRLLGLDQNVGFGAANNLGVREARGDTLLLLNSDASPRPGTIRRLQSALDQDERLALAAPTLLYPDGRPQIYWAPFTSLFGESLQKLRSRMERWPVVHRRPPLLLRPLIDRDWFTAACVLVRRAAYESIGGFDESFFLYFEDVDLCLRLRQTGWRLEGVDSAIATHIKGASGNPEGIDLAYRRSQLHYYALHRPGWEQRWLRRHLRRKFGRVAERDLRRQLLALLDS